MGRLHAMKLKYQKVGISYARVEGLCTVHKQIKTGNIFSPGTPDLSSYGFCCPVQGVLHHSARVMGEMDPFSCFGGLQYEFILH